MRSNRRPCQAVNRTAHRPRAEHRAIKPPDKDRRVTKIERPTRMPRRSRHCQRPNHAKQSRKCEMAWITMTASQPRDDANGQREFRRFGRQPSLWRRRVMKMRADLRHSTLAVGIVNHSFAKIGDDRKRPWAMAGICPRQILRGRRARIPTIACGADPGGRSADEHLTGRLDPVYLRNAPEQYGRTTA